MKTRSVMLSIAILLLFSPIVQAAENELRPTYSYFSSTNDRYELYNLPLDGYWHVQEKFIKNSEYNKSAYGENGENVSVNAKVNIEGNTPSISVNLSSSDYDMVGYSMIIFSYSFSVDSAFDMSVKLYVDSVLSVANNFNKNSSPPENYVYDHAVIADGDVLHSGSSATAQLAISSSSPDSMFPDFVLERGLFMDSQLYNDSEDNRGYPFSVLNEFNGNSWTDNVHVLVDEFTGEYIDLITIQTNTEYRIQLLVQVWGWGYDVTAMADPYLYLDEDFLAAMGLDPEAFTLVFSEGVNNYKGGSGGTDPGGNPGTNPVPEPTTMLLFATGLLGLAGMSRRKKN